MLPSLAWSRPPDAAAERGACWRCARLAIRDVVVARSRRVTYSCGLSVRAPELRRCAWFLREPGADDDSAVDRPRRRSGRWPVAGCRGEALTAATLVEGKSDVVVPEGMRGRTGGCH